jgi:hypothetical protein
MSHLQLLERDCEPIFDPATRQWKCRRCGYSKAEKFMRNCRPRHRPRTAAERKAIWPICGQCPHQTKVGDPVYDPYLCRLKLSGCFQCADIENFIAFIDSGQEGPDGRFAATEIVNLQNL